MKNHLVHRLDLKCDAPGCDYREPVAAISREFVGKLCPKCGATLLTEDDFTAGELMKSCLDELATIIPLEAVETVNDGDVLMSVNPHGGELKLGFRKVGSRPT